MSATRRQIAQATLDLLQRHSSKHVADALASYLVAERRSKDIDLVMRDVQALRQKQDSVQEVMVTSVDELSSSTRTALAQKLGSQKTIFNYQTDPNVVAGAQVRGLDWQLDMSVDSKLNKLKLAASQE